MTVTELKKKSGYSFECNMSEEFKDYEQWDEWGCAQVWLDNVGAEYNFCIDNGLNCSAIYGMMYNEELGYAETDYSDCEHYEIDFNSPTWAEDLENAMCNALIGLFLL